MFNGLFGASAANQVVSQKGSFVASTVDDGATSKIGGTQQFADVAAPVNDVYSYSSNNCKFCANGVNKDYKGNVIASSVIGDDTGNSGFPGFDPTPAQTLGYVAAMQETGIPVTFAYIRDAHDNWGTSAPPLVCPSRGTFGPGEACYVDQLKQENQAFQAFFERLAADGITQSNTLFVVTSDEGDHFAGTLPTNTGCDGVNTPCMYPSNGVGEQTARINDGLTKEFGDTNPFAIHFDDAPNFYVQGPTGTTSPPGPYDPAVRQLEQDLGGLTLTNQQTGTTEPVTQHLADAADQTILHITTQDPQRTPTFTDFADPTFFYVTGSCSPTNQSAGCPSVNPGFAWNHGGDQPEVTRTWLGLVGPTVQNLGETGSVWTDHTDIRPTVLSILGLRPDTTLDGSAISQLINPVGLPPSVAGHLTAYQDLMGAYKQLNASVGQFGHDSEIVSTTGSESVSPGDAVARGFDRQLTACQVQRDAVAGKMKDALNEAVFKGDAIHGGKARSLINRAYDLIGEMHTLSLMVVPPEDLVCGGDEGDQGGQGSRGDQGQQGPQGPQGDKGDRGPGGPRAFELKLVCLVKEHSHHTVVLRCVATRSEDHKALDRRVRATAGVVRGHRVFAYGSGLLRHLVLHTHARLRGGYVLTIDVAGYKPQNIVIHV
jgi:hypothetical protein